MRINISRIPYEKFSYSQSSLTNKEYEEEDKEICAQEEQYLKDMDQFYLDYQEYQKKKMQLIQLKHIQDVAKLANIVKREFTNEVLLNLNKREEIARKTMEIPIVDNTELENSVKKLETYNRRLKSKLKKTIDEKNSIKYDTTFITDSTQQKNNQSQIINDQNEKHNSETNENEKLSLENRLIQLQLENQTRELDLKRREAILNSETKYLDKELLRTQKALRIYRSSFATKLYKKPIEIKCEKINKEYPDKLQESLQKEGIMIQKHYLSERMMELKQIEVEINEMNKERQKEYDDLQKLYHDKINIFNEQMILKREFNQIKNEIAQNKMKLIDLTNEKSNLTRTITLQHDEFSMYNERREKALDNIKQLKEQIQNKENVIWNKIKRVQIIKHENDMMEEDLSTKLKLIELKQNTVRILHRQIEREMNLDKKKPAPKPMQRLLRLDALGLKKKSPSKWMDIRRNENIAVNQM
ncbi:hypothetical protein TRFO_05926 [Tritrichomonas foetus]|uniref:DUF4201 domain-containing protein n=1 Tax=Tritrichomonas foetus TaxID=1144522 RepID=A0A1J4K7G0_9EUKA|nr:hypothetical protein TRFO_05926 [Tritrichomonas foetus]|eukprot:OHT05349.1 hypothetical protein TRFO_05926 [Tritrichomonas foetus]